MPALTRIIAVAMQKGGTGKTTCAVNIAAGLARGVAPDVLGPQRVLLVDVDPQANATAVFLSPQFTLGPAEDVATTYEVLVNQTPAREAIKTIELSPNDRAGYPAATLDILPSHIRLARAELDLLGVIRREDRLASALRKVAKDYDTIIIDCPPSLGILTLNALIAAGEVIIPVEPGYFPLIGIGLLQRTIDDVAQINDLQILGVVPTLQDRTVESRETIEGLQRMFGDRVLPSIPSRIAVRNAHAAQMDLFAYATDATSKDSAQAFVDLVREIARD
jgi:chromosome partitioning protein